MHIIIPPNNHNYYYENINGCMDLYRAYNIMVNPNNSHFVDQRD